LSARASQKKIRKGRPSMLLMMMMMMMVGVLGVFRGFWVFWGGQSTTFFAPKQLQSAHTN